MVRSCVSVEPRRSRADSLRGWQGDRISGRNVLGTSGTAKARVNVPDVGSVTFAADQGPLHPLNALVGATVTLFKRLELFAEYSFNFDDVHVVAAGVSFRF